MRRLRASMGAFAFAQNQNDRVYDFQTTRFGVVD